MAGSSVPPVPSGFAETFAAGGWRAVERKYHARTEMLVCWYKISVAGRENCEAI